jgi:hypothetical protein
MATLRPNWPAGLPSPQVLQTATEAMCRQYVVPATMLHPMVAGQALELGYLLAAYGLAPADPHPAMPQSDIVVDAPGKPPRRAGFRNRRRAAGQRVQVLDAVVDTLT